MFFQDFDDGDYDCVVTYGSSSSNHCRIVANVAASRGIPCTIISPQEKSEETYNSKLIESFGAKVITVPVEEVHDTIEKTLDELKANGKKPYFIQGGGHGNIGTQAYVDCYEEIRAWEEEHYLHFDYIFFASGTATTQAGLVCGQLQHSDDRKIVGISIARPNPRGRDVVISSIKEYLGNKATDEQIDENTIFIDEYVNGGYGEKNSSVKNTTNEAMKVYGLPLDETYTGKAFYGMNEYLNKNNIKKKNVLFIHTGGTPLFFNSL